MRRTMRTISAMMCAALLLSACSAAKVRLMYFDNDPAMKNSCEIIVPTLPGHILDQGQRTIEPLSEAEKEFDLTKSAAVWGDPVISLICGVRTPETLTASSQLTEINGISWFAEETTNGYRFTSTNLIVRMQVRVPSDYAPETNVLVELSSSLSQYVAKD